MGGEDALTLQKNESDNKKLRKGRGIEKTHLKQARQLNIWEHSFNHY